MDMNNKNIENLLIAIKDNKKKEEKEIILSYREKLIEKIDENVIQEINYILNLKDISHTFVPFFIILLFESIWLDISPNQSKCYLNLLRLAYEYFDKNDIIRTLEDSSLKDLLEYLTLSDISRAIEIKSFNCATSEFPDRHFSIVNKFLKDAIFIKKIKSSDFIFFISNNWELFSESQKDDLSKFLIDTYPDYEDWMSQYTIINDIIVEFMDCNLAFATLKKMLEIKDETPRSFLPKGLEMIILNAYPENTKLVQEAYSILEMMKDEPSNAVRNEALESLKNIQRAT